MFGVNGCEWRVCKPINGQRLLAFLVANLLVITYFPYCCMSVNYEQLIPRLERYC